MRECVLYAGLVYSVIVLIFESSIVTKISGLDKNQEFNKSRMARSSVFPAASFNTPEESSFSQDVISTVENSMKKYTDNIMRFLEGISSRLSQLELYCYNLDKSIGEMRSDWVRDHGESESKLRSLEKHIQEVCLVINLAGHYYHLHIKVQNFSYGYVYYLLVPCANPSYHSFLKRSVICLKFMLYLDLHDFLHIEILSP